MQEKLEDENRVKGFEFSAISCGIKRPAALDLALMYSKVPAAVAGVFTQSRLPAAPVILDRERLKSGRARAVLANAGCANACTGSRGYEAAVATSRWVAEALEIPEEEVFVASTGVIGTSLPLDQIRGRIPSLVAGLEEGGISRVAQAIMTTDTRPKWIVRGGQIEGFRFGIGAVAKGAGMIHPQMATMLCFVVTDANISSRLLQDLLVANLDVSFHSITVDGDTSTNDTVLGLANGASGAPRLTPGSAETRTFEALFAEVLREMALALVRDAEGRTKLIHLAVETAADDVSARRVALAVAHSPLVKTALYGEDVNWGRIMAAIGYSGVEVSPDKIDLWYDQIHVVRAGQSHGPEAEERAQSIARQGEFTIRISLGMGEGKSLMHTCDLSHDYISINASYKT